MITTVKKLQKNPLTGKTARTIAVPDAFGKNEMFRWNAIYRVYNSTKNYHQLMSDELNRAVWLGEEK